MNLSDFTKNPHDQIHQLDDPDFSVDFDKESGKPRAFPLMIDESPNLPEPPRGDLLDDVLEQEEELSEHLQDPMLYEAFCN
ncbi:hypothetical protein PO124_21035 [Bacillus licheniformis]|nr:hypothetical protein [Bacillus licheniformis]